MLLLLITVVAAEMDKLTFFHLTDVHYDPSYDGTFGPTTLCRQAKGDVNARSSTMGPFGRYGCDAPIELVSSTLDKLKELEPDPAFILLTGDLAAHEATSKQVLTSVDRTMRLLRTYFPHTLIYPSIGNNDCPSDFGCSLGDSTWYHRLFTLWGRSMNNRMRESFLKGGYFWASPMPGLRVVSLNTIFYATQYVKVEEAPQKDVFLAEGGNSTLLSFAKHKDHDKHSSKFTDGVLTDPAGQFAWLEKVLEDAHDKKEAVYIAGHVPPGYSFHDHLHSDRPDNWHAAYVKKYSDLIHKYHASIKGQFFGHLHRDTFRVMYDRDEASEPIAFMLIAGSISPMKMNNPSFRMFEFFEKSFVLKDYHQFYLDLWLANSQVTASWKHMYSFLDAYSLSNWQSITPNTMSEVAQRLRFDDELSNMWLARHAAFYIRGRHMFECTNHVFSEEQAKECFEQAFDD